MENTDFSLDSLIYRGTMLSEPAIDSDMLIQSRILPPSHLVAETTGLLGRV
jgi:hypothetical protein